MTDSFVFQTPGAPIHFLVMREMERVILQESERLNHPANTKPANHPVNPEPSTPARFIFSAVMKVCVFLSHAFFII
jgi:hypothetical protein